MDYWDSGQYSRVFRQGNTIYVESNDVVKEALTHCQHPLCPKIKPTKKAFFNYQMPYYKELGNVSDELVVLGEFAYMLNDWYIQGHSSDITEETALIIANEVISKATGELKNALTEILAAVVEVARKKYGRARVFFDLKYDNLAVDGQGNLILLDPMWCMDQPGLEESGVE